MNSNYEAGYNSVVKAAGLEKVAVRAESVLKTLPGGRFGNFGKLLSRHSDMAGRPLREVVQKQYPKAKNLIQDLEHVDKVRLSEGLPVTPGWSSDVDGYRHVDAAIDMSTPSASVYAHELRHAMQFSAPDVGGVRALRVTDPADVRRSNIANIDVDPNDYGLPEATLKMEADANNYAMSMSFTRPQDRVGAAAHHMSYANLYAPKMNYNKQDEDFTSYLTNAKRDKAYSLAKSLMEKGNPAHRRAWNLLSSINHGAADSLGPFKSRYWDSLAKQAPEDASEFLQVEMQRHKASVDYIRNALGDQAANDYNEHVLQNLQRVAPEDAMSRFRGLWNEQ